MERLIKVYSFFHWNIINSRYELIIYLHSNGSIVGVSSDKDSRSKESVVISKRRPEMSINVESDCCDNCCFRLCYITGRPICVHCSTQSEEELLRKSNIQALISDKLLII